MKLKEIIEMLGFTYDPNKKTSRNESAGLVLYSDRCIRIIKKTHSIVVSAPVNRETMKVRLLMKPEELITAVEQQTIVFTISKNKVCGYDVRTNKKMGIALNSAGTEKFSQVNECCLFSVLGHITKIVGSLGYTVLFKVV